MLYIKSHRLINIKAIFIILVLGIVTTQLTHAAQPIKLLSYKDNKTNLTLVVAETTLTGRYYPEQPAPSAPISQLAILKAEPATLANNQDKYTPYYLISKDTKVTYQLAAILKDTKAQKALITLRNQDTNEVTTLSLNLTEVKQHAASLADFQKWVQARFFSWKLLAKPNTNDLIHTIWKQKSKDIYGVAIDPYAWRDNRRNTPQSDGIASLAVFGGQTAIYETLQTQLLANNASPTNQAATLVDINTIEAVKVKAHPYTEMLAQLQAPSKTTIHSSLANYVPIDRFMVLIKEPKDIANLFDPNNELVTRLTPLLGNGFIDYALLERYSARFGLTPEQLKQWFTGNNVAEIAIFTPDVFFLDSTELTFIIRLKPEASTPFKLAQKIPSVVLPLQLPKGETFYLINKDDLLIIASNKAELERVLQLANNKGKGSLGESAEFKVMNYKLPFNADSRIYVYFSDPFIRRLTGPEVKIGQLRRAIARQQMETITAMALLYRLDHGVDAADIATLKKHGYLTANEAPEDEFTLEKGPLVISKTWGTLSNLKTLLANPISQVTAQEAANYAAYRDRYTRFWQQYFDPIAVRADFMANGNMALETFILPLIDNSLYQSLKIMVGSAPPATTTIPSYSKPPVANLVLNIPKQHATVLTDNIFYAKYYLTPLLPSLGNTAVLSIQDAAPVIQSYFPGLIMINEANTLGVNNEMLLAVPIMGALLTRPVDIAIQITDEEQVRKFLKNFYSMNNDRYFSLQATYNEADNSLLLDWTAANLLRMELRVTVENGWLHISNHPWTPTPIIASQQLTPNHISMLLAPTQLVKGLPQLASLAQANYRQSVYSAATELLPWMLAYQVDAQTAANIQKVALGFSTPLPPEVTFETTPLLTVKPYGSWSKQIMPDVTLKDQNTFIQSLQNLNLWLRFEEDGLRSRAEFSHQ